MAVGEAALWDFMKMQLPLLSIISATPPSLAVSDISFTLTVSTCTPLLHTSPHYRHQSLLHLLTSLPSHVVGGKKGFAQRLPINEIQSRSGHDSLPVCSGWWHNIHSLYIHCVCVDTQTEPSFCSNWRWMTTGIYKVISALLSSILG